jgi:DNA-binding transcriptional ArsR family regulator
MPDSPPSSPDIPAIADIDRVIHEPARLTIMAHLFVVSKADFLFLKQQTGLTWGNLSSHLTRLEAAGYVEIEKIFVERKPHTIAHLTEEGRTAFQKYRERMKQVIE